MNQQTNMADTAAADLVQGIATQLYGDDGAGITDLITLANRVQVDAVNPVSGDARAQFEAWAYRECLTLHRYDSGQYSYGRTVSAWLAWQAALAAAQPSLAGHGEARERDGWRKIQKAAASQTRKDGVGA